MKIINLNDDDLQIFLESLPEEFVRNLFNNLKSLHDSLKGFRIKSAPMKQLIKIVLSSLKDEHDSKVEKVIESFYEDYKKTIKEEVSKYISSGYSEKEANALAIEDGLTEKFIPIYFKLEEIDDDFKTYYYNRINEGKELNIKIENVVLKYLEKMNQKIAELESKSNNLEKTIDAKIKENDELKKELIQYKKNIDSAVDKVNNLMKIKTNNNETNYSEEFEKIYNILDELKNKNNTNVDVSERLKGLEELILNNSERIDNINQENGVNQNFDVIFHDNNEYDLMDDLDVLKDDIGDSISGFIPNNLFDNFREFIIECLYNKKPLLANKNNALKICKILSSVLTGGNYYEIDILNREFSNAESLINRINQIVEENDYSVILIRNFMSYNPYNFLLDKLKYDYKSKIIFDINYSKELRYMPIEIINDFIVFDYQLNDAEIEYSYKYELPERKPITNKKFDEILAEIGYSLNEIEIYNVKYDGLLIFSYIPFIAINCSKELKELINRITDSKTRTSCEALLNE